MPKSLPQRLAPLLRNLDKGGYIREYRKGDRRFRSSLHLAVGEILQAVSSKTKENVPVPGTGLVADYEVGGRYVFVDRGLGNKDLAKLERYKQNCIMIETSPTRSDREDTGIRVIGVGSKEGPDLQTIFLDDPSFNFDYAHILPHTMKCSVMHGHTSAALVEVIGRPNDGMVVDFGVAKDIIREAIRSLDHKLFINEKYVVREDAKSVTLRFQTVHGEFAIVAPKQTTVLLEGEATVENLAKEVLSRISSRMPKNVSAVGVYVYEGLNKGSHLLAQLHQRGVGKTRNKR